MIRLKYRCPLRCDEATGSGEPVKTDEYGQTNFRWELSELRPGLVTLQARPYLPPSA
jgi:hypothetical protein